LICLSFVTDLLVRHIVVAVVMPSERFKVPKPGGFQLIHLLGSGLAIVVGLAVIVYFQYFALEEKASAFLGFVLIVIALAFLAVVALHARALGQLRQAAPGELVFTLSSSGQTGKALQRALEGTQLGARAAGFTVSLGASAGTDGVSFWDNNPPQFAGRIDWSQIRSVSFAAFEREGGALAAYQNASSRNLFMPILSVDSAGGDVTRVPLDGANPSRLPGFGTTLYTHWIADQLSVLHMESRTRP
jgi:hypothetical protein